MGSGNGRKAIIFGAGGQDGRYLSAYLAERGYAVVGAGEREPAGTRDGVRHAKCDIADAGRVSSLIASENAEEVYNLAVLLARNGAKEEEERANEVNVRGPENVLDAIARETPSARFFQASTGYIFKPGPGKKSEESEFGAADFHSRTKLEAHMKVVNARKRGLFAVNGILFNHESPIGRPEFLLKKVASAAALLAAKRESAPLRLGNLAAVRDWGFARDYVEAMHLMLSAAKPQDFVIATGVGHTVRDACELAYGAVGENYAAHVEVDPRLFRAGDADYLVGNPEKIGKELGWKAKTGFAELVELMVRARLREIRSGGGAPG